MNKLLIFPYQQIAMSIMLIGFLSLGTSCSVEKTTTPEPAPTSDTEPKSNTAPVTSSPEALTEEFKQQVTKVLSQKLGVGQDKLSILRFTKETWPDSCLGLPESDEICAQIVVEGWQIQVMEGEKDQFYRTDSTGDNLRLIKSDSLQILPPSIQEKVLESASAESGISVSELEIVEAKPQVWDGCLNVPPSPETPCPEIGIFGWQVVVAAKSQRLVYHTNQDGSDIRRAGNREWGMGNGQ